MKATMASIQTSFNIAKEKCKDLIYFVEDDYIHKRESIFEMISSYEKLSSELEENYLYVLLIIHFCIRN